VRALDNIADKFLPAEEKTSDQEKIPKLDVAGSTPVARSKILSKSHSHLNAVLAFFRENPSREQSAGETQVTIE
jgi:hypothetical protein